MTLFMDVHNHVEGLTAEAVAGAHARDLEVQDAHNVKYLQYWSDERSGKVFCLVEAPAAEAAIAVHREAHGLVADEITPAPAAPARTAAEFATAHGNDSSTWTPADFDAAYCLAEIDVQPAWELLKRTKPTTADIQPAA